MWMRFIVLWGLLGLVCLPSLAAEGDIPRTPSGKPDLSGNYELLFLTPFERDPKHGTNLYMSAEEGRKIEESVATAIAQADVPSDPDRVAPPVGGDGHRSNVGGYNQFVWFDTVTTTFAVDGKYRTSILTDPPNGRLPPLTEVAKKKRQAAQRRYNHNPGGAWWLETGEDLYDHPEFQNLTTRCLYNGGATVPVRQTGGYNNLKTIVQTDTHIVILVEWFHWPRVIRLDSEHLPEEIRSMAGDSIGWWEGDTLVVDTTNFRRPSPARASNDRRRAERDKNFLRSPGVPHEGLHVVERFARVDADTLLYEFTVEDPDYTAPYSGSLPWPQTEKRLYEYACHEGNYSMGNILRGARLAEKEWLDRQGGLK